MELLVGEEPFAVTVVVLEEEILVVAFEDAVIELEDGVVVELPTFTFHQSDGASPSAVLRHEACAHLVDAGVVEDVAVLGAVDNRQPELSMDHYLWVDHDASSEADFVPGARGCSVASV